MGSFRLFGWMADVEEDGDQKGAAPRKRRHRHSEVGSYAPPLRVCVVVFVTTTVIPFYASTGIDFLR